MNIGDMVERKEILGYRGILLEQMYMLPETIDSQLSLYEDEQWSYWKVLWFKHPYQEANTQSKLLGRTTCVETYNERLLYRHDTI